MNSFPKRPIPLLTPDVLKLEERLRLANIGDIVTYEELSKLVQRDIKLKERYLMTTALRRLEVEERRVFLCVKNQGWQRVNDEDKVKSGTHMNRSIRRKAARMDMRMCALDDYAKLSADLRLVHSGLRAVAAVITRVTSNPGFKRLQQCVTPSDINSRPDVKKLLAAFIAKPETTK